MGPARWQDGGYDHRYSWLVYSIPERWPGAMAPVAQGDADQTLRRPFLPSALQRRPGAQPRERLLDQRPEQGDEAERHDRTDEPVGEEDAEASLRGQQRLPEGLLGLVAEHDRQHEGRERIVALLQDVSDHAENQHHDHVERRIMDAVGPDGAEHQYDRCDDAEGNAQDRGKQRHASQYDQQSDDIAEIHRGDQTPDELLLLDEQQRTRLQAPDQEAPEQHRRGRRARNAERQHGQQRRGAGRMRGGFRRDHAFDLAAAEPLAVLRHALGDAVAHERGRRRARGTDAHPASDHAGAQRRHPVARKLRPSLEYDLRIDAGRAALEAQSFLDGEQDLADAEQADHRDEEVEPVKQLGEAEGQPQLAGHAVQSHGCERKADHHRGHRLEWRLLAHADEAAEGEKIDPELFRRSELQGKFGYQGRNERDQDHRKQRTDERRREGGGEGLARATLLRHRMAVEGGCHRPWLARNVEQHRGDRAAEQRAPVDAGQHDDRRGRRHRERQRQQDRDAVGAAEAGQHPDNDAKHDTDEHYQQVERLDDDGEAVK